MMKEMGRSGEGAKIPRTLSIIVCLGKARAYVRGRFINLNEGFVRSSGSFIY